MRDRKRKGIGGRLRLTLLLATAAAFLLAPATQASAAGTAFVEVLGSGAGEIFNDEEAGFSGSPPMDCHGFAPGEGTCENTLANFFGFEAELLGAIGEEGFEFVKWEIFEGIDADPIAGSDTCRPASEPRSEDEEEFGPGRWCMVGNSTEKEAGTNVEVGAEFQPCEAGSEDPGCITKHPLTLNINEGEGTVVSDPAGIECTGSEGESCEAGFEEGAEVTLTASPAAGYRFFRWENCPTGNFGDRQCTVTISEAKEVGVKFRKAWNLDLSKTGNGVGTIKNTSNGLTCPISCTETNLFLFEGQEITVFAAAPGKNQFVEFSGGTGAAAVCDGQVECTYTVEADASTEAVINQYPKATLSLSKEGGGETRITGAMFCNNACTSISGSFYTGPTPEEVTIGWDLKDGTSSIEWTSAAGTCTGKSEADEGTCTVTMDEAHTLVAKLE